MLPTRRQRVRPLRCKTVSTESQVEGETDLGIQIPMQQDQSLQARNRHTQVGLDPQRKIEKEHMARPVGRHRCFRIVMHQMIRLAKRPEGKHQIDAAQEPGVTARSPPLLESTSGLGGGIVSVTVQTRCLFMPICIASPCALIPPSTPGWFICECA